jgi:tetratricopeptide (TPR) repeat protein
MRIQIHSAICLLLLASPATLAQELVPVPPTVQQDSLFKVAIELYDKGEYEQAINIYSSALDQNPDFLAAIAELSMTYTAAQKYDLAVATALRGLKYKSGYRRDLYLNLGNAYDMLNKPNDAILAYRNGLDLDPNAYLLHYNLGFTFMRTNEADSARIHLQSALRSNPSHAGSNLALAQLYHSLGKRVSAVFAYSRFLILEPNGARSGSAAATLRSLLSDSMSIRSNGPGQMTISVSPDSDVIDGNLSPLELSLSMTQATRLTKDSIFGSSLASIASDLSSFFQITSEIINDKTEAGFIWNYYAPYFASLHKRGFTEVATRFVFRSTDKAEVLDFLRTRMDTLQDFKAWNSAYDWGQ